VDVRWSQFTGQQFLLIEVDHDLHVLPAVGVRQHDAGNRHQQRTNSHVGKVIELRGREVVRADLKHGDGDRGRGETHDHGRRDIGGKRLDDVLRDADDIRLRPAHIDAVLKKNVRDATAVVRVTMNVLDAFHRRGQEALKQIGDAPFHLLWQQAGIDPNHGSHRNGDVWKHVGGHLVDRQGPHRDDKDGHDDEGVGPTQGNKDNCIHRRRLSEAGQWFPIGTVPSRNR
jgi:hypothetical protein